MRCQESEERILEFVTGAAGGTQLSPAVEEHVAECPACRALLEDSVRIWRDLGRIPLPPPGPVLRDRLYALLAEAAVARRPRRTSRNLQVAALVAAVLIGGLGGYALASGSSGRLASDERASGVAANAGLAGGPTFLLLLREGEAFPVTGADTESLVAEYADWARRLAADGRLAAAEKLAGGGRLLAPAGDSVAVSPLPVSAGEERIGGFFVIRASDLDDAIRIARRAPHLRHGGSIELRRVDTEH